jgi:hypothetical protein
MKMANLLAANLVLSILIANPAPVVAQARQIVTELGMRLLLPTNWEWFRRDSNEIFINCSPEKIEGFGCSLIVTERKAPAGQTAITDADRRLWRSWQLATGGSRIISSRDITLAGYPAYEIISEDPLRSMQVFVLVPKTSRQYEIAFAAGSPANKNADYYRYKPAADAALQTFAIVAE